MKPEERQRVLRERLTANWQRLARQDYLRALPISLRSYLEHCPIVQTPAFDTLVPLFWVSADGIGEPRYKPDGYMFAEYSSPDQALAAALNISTACDHQASYFWPSGGNPIYEAEFGWVRQHLHDLWPYSPQEIGVISTDHAAGLVISNYCGYLPYTPNPDEVIYEVAVWRPPEVHQ